MGFLTAFCLLPTALQPSVLRPGLVQLVEVCVVESAVLVGHRGDAKADEVARYLAAAVEADVVRGRGLHLDCAVWEFEFDDEGATLVNDAGVAEVDRVGDQTDARLAQVARAAIQPLVRE